MCKRLRGLVAVIGNRRTRKAFYMGGFRQIGTIAAKLVSVPGQLQAAADQSAANGWRGAGSSGGCAPNSSPMLKQPGGAVASNSELVKKAGTPVSETSRPVEGGQYRVKQVRETTLNTPLTMSRSMATVYSTAPHRESFARSAVVIDLCMWKERHSTASGAR